MKDEFKRELKIFHTGWWRDYPKDCDKVLNRQAVRHRMKWSLWNWNQDYSE